MDRRIDRSIGREMDQSPAWSKCGYRPIGRSFNQHMQPFMGQSIYRRIGASIDRRLGRLIDRSIRSSIGRSIHWSIGRLIDRKNKPIYELFYSQQKKSLPNENLTQTKGVSASKLSLNEQQAKQQGHVNTNESENKKVGRESNFGCEAPLVTPTSFLLLFSLLFFQFKLLLI